VNHSQRHRSGDYRQSHRTLIPLAVAVVTPTLRGGNGSNFFLQKEQDWSRLRTTNSVHVGSTVVLFTAKKSIEINRFAINRNLYDFAVSLA